MRKPLAIVCDLDQTLIDSAGRSVTMYRDGKSEKWAAWSEDGIDDAAHAWAVAIVTAMNQTHMVHFVTARPATARAATLAWLALHLSDIAPSRYQLHMRSSRHLDQVLAKMQLVEKLQRRWRIVCAFDDHFDTCEMYQALGIPALHVLPAALSGAP